MYSLCCCTVGPMSLVLAQGGTIRVLIITSAANYQAPLHRSTGGLLARLCSSLRSCSPPCLHGCPLIAFCENPMVADSHLFFFRLYIGRRMLLHVAPASNTAGDEKRACLRSSRLCLNAAPESVCLV